jgi:hypothetical protein
MKKIPLLLTLAWLGSSPALAQITFERTFGGSGTDLGFSVQETSDGGFILAGSTQTTTPQGTEMVLMKTDAYGTELWSHTFGTQALDFAYSVRQTMDGGYVLCGMFGGFGTDTLTVVRTTADGSMAWVRHYPGGLTRDVGYCIRETADGGFVISGFAGPSGNTDVYIVKIDAAGNELWTTLVDLGANDFGNAVIPLSGGGYIVLADDGEIGSDGDLHLLRLSDTGDSLWTRTYGTSAHDHARGLWLTQDGGFILAGGSGYPDRDILLVRTDAQGNELWQRSIGDPALDELARDVQQLEDGGYIVCGRKEDPITGEVRMLLFRTDADGYLQWERLFGQGVLTDANALDRTSDGGFVLIGSTTDIIGGSAFTDIYLVRTDGSGYTTISEAGHDAAVLSLAPVPASDKLHVAFGDLAVSSVLVFDASGRLIREWPVAGPAEFQLPVDDLRPGSYLLAVLDASGTTRIRRFMVAR